MGVNGELLVTIGGSRQAIWPGLFHLDYNLASGTAEDQEKGHNSRDRLIA
jgi:hypothetical protein